MVVDLLGRLNRHALAVVGPALYEQLVVRCTEGRLTHRFTKRNGHGGHHLREHAGRRAHNSRRRTVQREDQINYARHVPSRIGGLEMQCVRAICQGASGNLVQPCGSEGEDPCRQQIRQHTDKTIAGRGVESRGEGGDRIEVGHAAGDSRVKRDGVGGTQTGVLLQPCGDERRDQFALGIHIVEERRNHSRIGALARRVHHPVSQSAAGKTEEAADDRDSVAQRVGILIQVDIERRADGVQIILNLGRIGPLARRIDHAVGEGVPRKPEQMPEDDDAVREGIGLAVQIHVETG